MRPQANSCVAIATMRSPHTGAPGLSRVLITGLTPSFHERAAGKQVTEYVFFSPGTCFLLWADDTVHVGGAGAGVDFGAVGGAYGEMGAEYRNVETELIAVGI